mgnify:CR=1 FL=1
MKLKITISIVTFFFVTTIFSQRFLEKQLPSPDYLSSFFIGPLVKSTIHYGEKPSNFNGEVLLFNHGYIDLNQLFFTNNTFYEEAYNSGYQVAFVATTRGKGMWKNGELLAEAIDIITEKYNVNQLSILAHSNGGKAAEVAMFSHNKSYKVKKVFALGTPFWGTYLADVSQQWWFNWIWSKTGLNEGSATSTTYYCRDVVRPYFDSLSNNEPEKFYVFGASGFSNGHTLLSPLMLTSGAILYVVQGTNDGVTAYSSSLRPRANFLFKKGEAKYDHIDVAFGQYVWKHIKPYLNDNLNVNLLPDTSNNSRNIISSNYQIINSENGYDQLVLDKHSKSVQLEVFHEKKAEDFTLYTNNMELKKAQMNRSNVFDQYCSRYVLKSSETAMIEGNSRFAAFAHFPDGPKMNYEVIKHENTVNISFENIETPVKNIEVVAVIDKTNTLLGNKTSSETVVLSLDYESESNSFILDTSSFSEGVYSTFITANDSNFKRSLVSGFTIGNLSNQKMHDNTSEIQNLPILDINLVTNTVYNSIDFINTSNLSINAIAMKIYTLNGKLVISENLTANYDSFTSKGAVSGLSGGLYIVNIEYQNTKKTFKILKK